MIEKKKKSGVTYKDIHMDWDEIGIQHMIVDGKDYLDVSPFFLDSFTMMNKIEEVYQEKVRELYEEQCTNTKKTISSRVY